MLAHGAVGELATSERVTEHGIVHEPIALPEAAGAVVVEPVGDVDVHDVGTRPAPCAGGRDLDLVVEQIDLAVDPVGFVTADTRDTIAATVALHQVRVPENTHGDRRVLVADRPVGLDQIFSEVVEVGHLVLRRLVTVRRGDATQECVGPVLVADGAQVVAPDGDRDEGAAAVTGDVGGAHLGGDLTDDRTGAGDEHRVGVELVGQAWTGSLVEFTLAGTRSEPGRAVERVRLGAVVVVVGCVAVDAAARAVRVAERDHAFDPSERHGRGRLGSSGHGGADTDQPDRRRHRRDSEEGGRDAAHDH